MVIPAATHGHQQNGKATSPFAGKRIWGYRRAANKWFFHPALREGRFSRMDIPAMQIDNAVQIGLLAIYGALNQATFEVRANGKDIKTFVESTLHRFWAHDQPKVANQYVPWGTCVGEVRHELDNESGYWRYAGLDDFDLDDIHPWKKGRHVSKVHVSYGSSMMDGRTGPIQVNPGVQPEKWNVIEPPKLFWCTHRATCGDIFGKSALEAAFGPWMEKCGSHGAISIRRLWAFSNAFRGCMVKYPVGSTQGQDDIQRDNQDIAREIAEAYCTGAAVTCPSGTDSNGKPLWEIVDPRLNGEIKGLMEYPGDLNRDIWMGMGVPDEVLHAPETGGIGPVNRSGPQFIFLSICDSRVREILTAFDVGPSGYTTRNEQSGGVIRPLVMENFGATAKYEIIPISLVPKAKEPGAGGTPGPGGGMPGPPPPAPPGGPGPQGGGPQPPPGAPQPLQLSAAIPEAVELPDEAVEVILAEATSLSASLFDESSVNRGEGGRFTFKPIKAEHVKAAQKAFKAGKLSVKRSEEPIVSDASGAAIHHHVELESGQKVHPDELHRLRVEDGETLLHHDEGLTIHEPSGKSKATSFSDALHRVKAGKLDEPVTIESGHGYSSTRPRSEWVAHRAGHDEGQSFSEWYDAEGHNHTGRHVESPGGATLASDEDTDRLFAPQAGGQGRLAFSGAFEESKHPRDDSGRWTHTGVTSLKAFYDAGPKAMTYEEIDKHADTLASLTHAELKDAAKHILGDRHGSALIGKKKGELLERVRRAFKERLGSYLRTKDIGLSGVWDPLKHHRGQPGNKGQFGPGGGSSSASAPAGRPSDKPAQQHAQKPAAPAPAPLPNLDASEEARKMGIIIPPHPIQFEPKTEPPPGGYHPDITKDTTGNGVADAARVGVPADVVPPPPPIPRLDNLTPHERTVERSFAKAFEENPAKLAGDFLALTRHMTKPGDPPTFGTDDAKVLTDAWSVQDKTQRAQNRATLNTPLHQTANAIAKRAFLMHMDTLKKGDELLVTCGGCGSGKGFALKMIPKAKEIKGRCKGVWDSAGDQSATENPWIQAEAEKRGLKVNYLYVHADPKAQWAHPKMGVVARAADPADGRMVGAMVFADSYANGARNMQAFVERNQHNPHAAFTFLQNSGPQPVELPGIPKESLQLDAHELAAFAIDTVSKSEAPAHVKRGALMDQRIWGNEHGQQSHAHQPA